MDLTQVPIFTQILIGIFIFISIFPSLLLLIKTARKKINKRRDPSINLHETCPNYDNLILQRDAEIRKAIKRYKLENIEKLNMQLIVMERAVDRIKAHAIGVITDRSGDPRDIRHYSSIMDQVERNILIVVKQWIKTNGLLEKDDSTFKRYAQETAESILMSMANDMDIHYNSNDFNIPRIELKKYFADNHNKDYIEIFEDALYKIRKIEKDYKEKVEKLL